MGDDPKPSSPAQPEPAQPAPAQPAPNPGPAIVRPRPSNTEYKDITTPEKR